MNFDLISQNYSLARRRILPMLAPLKTIIPAVYCQAEEQR